MVNDFCGEEEKHNEKSFNWRILKHERSCLTDYSNSNRKRSIARKNAKVKRNGKEK